MSDLAEKLEGGRGTSGRARATMKQLCNRWGCELTPTADTITIRLRSMGHEETWVRVAGRGAEALFERES